MPPGRTSNEMRKAIVELRKQGYRVLTEDPLRALCGHMTYYHHRQSGLCRDCHMGEIKSGRIRESKDEIQSDD